MAKPVWENKISMIGFADAAERIIMAIERLLGRLKSRIFMYRLKRSFRALKYCNPVIAENIENSINQTLEDVLGGTDETSMEE